MAFAVAFSVVQLIAPGHAEGQRLPARMQFAPAEIALHDPTGTPTHLRLPSEFAETTLARPRFSPLAADTAIRGLKRRVLPYAVGGAIIGGAIGYAAMPKSCDVGENMFCQYTRIGYPFVGIGVGAWAGILVGYFRERR